MAVFSGLTTADLWKTYRTFCKHFGNTYVRFIFTKGGSSFLTLFFLSYTVCIYLYHFLLSYIYILIKHIYIFLKLLIQCGHSGGPLPERFPHRAYICNNTYLTTIDTKWSKFCTALSISREIEAQFYVLKWEILVDQWLWTRSEFPTSLNILTSLL